MANINDYLDEIALEKVTSVDNSVKIKSLRQNVPYHFLRHLDFDVKPSIYSKISEANDNMAAATVTDYNTASRQNKRGSLNTFILEKFPISNHLIMDEKEVLNLEHILSQTANPETVIFQRMFNDVSLTKKGLWERLEYYFLQLLSTGKIVLDETSNYDGLNLTIDLEVSSDNKYTATTDWDTSGSATPIADVKSLLKDCNANGYYPDMINMTKTQLNYLTATTEFKNYNTTALGNSAQSQLIGIQQINEVFQFADLLPINLITDATTVLNSSGNKVSASAWDSDWISFSNSGMLGNVAVATPPKSGNKNMIYSVAPEGYLTSVTKKYDPLNVKTQSRMFAMVNMPSVYNTLYMKILNT